MCFASLLIWIHIERDLLILITLIILCLPQGLELDMVLHWCRYSYRWWFRWTTLWIIWVYRCVIIAWGFNTRRKVQMDDASSVCLTLQATRWGHSFPKPRGGWILRNMVTTSMCFIRPLQGTHTEQARDQLDIDSNTQDSRITFGPADSLSRRLNVFTIESVGHYPWHTLNSVQTCQ